MTQPDVNIPPVSPGQPVVPPVTPPVTPPPVQPGEKTDSALLLKSLQEERDKRRDLEAKLKELEDAVASGDTSSAEGKILKDQIATLEATITSIERKSSLADLHVQYPALKDKSAEFDAYVNNPDNKGISLKNAAKNFLAENDLLEAPPVRKGIEKPSGGGRQSQPVGWTFASIEELRKNNFRQYSKLLKEGAFKEVDA